MRPSRRRLSWTALADDAGRPAVTHERLKDSKGQLIPTVVASHLSAAAQQEVEKAARSRENQLLALLAKPASRNASQRDLANQLGWFTRDGAPYQMLVSRTISMLKREKLVTTIRGTTELTPAGRKYVEGNKSSVKKRIARKRRRASRVSKPTSGTATQVGPKRNRKARTRKVAASSPDNLPSETGA